MVNAWAELDQYSLLPTLFRTQSIYVYVYCEFAASLLLIYWLFWFCFLTYIYILKTCLK